MTMTHPIKITSLYQLDNGDFPIAYYYDLTAETMAMLTDYPRTKLEGFFGPGSMGVVEIHYEQDMSWRDVAECMDGSHEAIIPIQYRNDWLVDTKYDPTDKAIDKIIDAFNELKSRHYWREWDFHDEDGVPFKTLDRYAQRLGYMVNRHCLIGQSQGDSLDVLHITRLDRLYETSALYCEVAPYWEGNCFCIDVRLSSPYTDEADHYESMGFIIGRDRYILDTAKEMVQFAIADITTRKKKG